jgi:hypothetical protein
MNKGAFMAPAAFASASGFVQEIHNSPAELLSSKSTAIGCKRARDSGNDSDFFFFFFLLKKQMSEVELDAWPVTALGWHGGQ